MSGSNFPKARNLERCRGNPQSMIHGTKSIDYDKRKTKSKGLTAETISDNVFVLSENLWKWLLSYIKG